MINALYMPRLVPAAATGDPDRYDDDHDVSGLIEED